MGAKIVSLNVGGPKPLAYHGKYVESGFVKKPVFSPVWLSKINLEGDRQADLRVHGGVDKAVCVYPLEHYPYWEERLDRKLNVAAFGENFSTEGFTESNVYIGDVFRVGSPGRGPVVQVSQPRQPCYKLGARYDLAELVLWVQDSGATGFYLRVIEEGEVRPGDGLDLIERPHPDASVAEANRVMHQDRRVAEGLKRLAGIGGLSSSWRRKFEKRLEGEIEDVCARIEGPRRSRG